ncbi:hypothetical protein VS868_11950 [Salinimicrobium sp. 3283s]|uniref:hypothetical protein n=1 Tax=Salinimicrobium sp. 3283s TaxID=3114359 RepID=UPI0031F1B2E5
MPEEVRLSQEEFEQIEDLAACNYSPEQIAKYLDIRKEDFMAAWYNHRHPVRHHYDRGQLVADVEINQKALETAKAGNLTAMQVYQKNRETVHVENLKKQILFAGENLDDDE